MLLINWDSKSRHEKKFNHGEFTPNPRDDKPIILKLELRIFPVYVMKYPERKVIPGKSVVT